MGGTSSSSMSSNDSLLTIVSPMPDKQDSGRKGVGGTFSHQPNCRCNPCKARNRKQEALALAARARGMQLAPEHPVPQVGLEPVPKMQPPAFTRATKGLREKVASFITFSTVYPNISKAELAEKMGIPKSALHKMIKDAQEAGILTFDDPLDRVEHELIPKVIDNLNYFLDAKDRTVTIEAAKGTVFRQFQESKGISDNAQTVLALKIEQADGQTIKIATGRIVGQPKELEVVE